MNHSTPFNEGLTHHVSSNVSADDFIPLSYNQEQLWFIHKSQGSIQYHIPIVLTIKGHFNIAAAEKHLKQY